MVLLLRAPPSRVAAICVPGRLSTDSPTPPLISHVAVDSRGVEQKIYEDLEFVGLQVRDEGVDRGVAGGRGGDARAGDHVRASLRSD